MSVLKKAVHKIYRLGYRAIKNHAELARLSGSGSLQAAAVARAIVAAATGQMSGEERDYINRIEALRQQLMTLEEPINTAIRDGESHLPSVGYIARKASFHKTWALLLFHLIRETHPETCLELGTSLGISASYQAAALKLNGTGKLTTLEGSSDRVRWAKRNFEQLGLENTDVVVGPFQETLPDVLDSIGQLNLVFNDGQHEEAAVLSYFEQMRPYYAPDAILVFDNIRWSEGMLRAWTRITADPGIAFSVNLFGIGICGMGSPVAPDNHFTVALM